MSIRPRINFNNVYPFERVSSDLRNASFKAPLEDGRSIILRIKISEHPDKLMPNGYNLSFGPYKSNNKIDGQVELNYIDSSKVFSTILLFGLTYLMCNQGHSLGVDGSDDRRIRFYWIILHLNFDYLSGYFEMYGLKYYVRLSRFGKLQYENPFDFEDVFGNTVQIAKSTGRPKLMYNYLIFSLKNSKLNSWIRKEKMK